MRYFLLSLACSLAAAISLVAGYWNKPDAQTCQAVNSVYISVGHAQACSSSPAAGNWAAFGIFLFGAVVFIVLGNNRKGKAA